MEFLACGDETDAVYGVLRHGEVGMEALKLLGERRTLVLVERYVLVAKLELGDDFLRRVRAEALAAEHAAARAVGAA